MESRVTPTIAEHLYVQASLKQPKWQDLLTEKGYCAIWKYADEINGRSDLAISCILGALSFMARSETRICIGETWKIKPNLCILGIGPPGAGKSQTYDGLVEKPILHLEQQLPGNGGSKKRKVFLTSDFTRSGLMSFMEDNSNSAIFAAPEIMPKIDSIISSRSEEYVGFRSTLNSFWDGTAVRKDFKTQKNLILPFVHLVICGMAQPMPLISTMRKLFDMQDGLLDRFLCLTSPDKAIIHKEPDEMLPKIHQSEEGKKAFFEDEILHIYSALLETHCNGQTRIYKLTQEAVKYVWNKKEECRQNEEDRYERIAQRIINNEPAPVGEPSALDKFYFSKDLDYSVKLAVLLKIFNSLFCEKEKEVILRNDCSDIFFIGEDDLKKGFNLMRSIRDQMNQYLSFTDAVVNSTGTKQLRLSQPLGSDDLISDILLFPGVLVTSRMLTRTRQGRGRGFSVREVMDNLSQLNEDDPRFVGMLKDVSNNQVVFFKAPPNLVSKDVLSEVNITIAEYAAKYAISDISVIRNNCSIKNFETLYPRLLAKKPNFNNGLTLNETREQVQPNFELGESGE